MEDIKGYATPEDSPGRPADLPGRTSSSSMSWHKRQEEPPFQTVKNLSEEEGCCGVGAWVKLLRAYKGKNASRSQRLTERVHDIKRVSSYSEVLARRDMWEAALEEHDLDTGCEVADITMANCLRRLVDPCLSADFLKMSHTVRCCNVKKNIIDQVGLRLCHDQERPKGEPNGVKPLDTSFAAQSHDDETGETLAKLRAKV